MLAHAWICIPALTYRIVYSPLTGWINYLIVYLGFGTAFLLTFIVVEYYCLKYLAVVVFKRMLPIMDDFLAMFMLPTNLSVTALLTYVNMSTSESMMYERRLAGLQPTFWIGSVIKIPLMEGSMLLQTALPIYCSLMVKREKAKFPTRHDSHQQTGNRSKYNQEAITMTLGVVVVLVATAYLMVDMEANFVEGYNDNVSRLVLYLVSDLFYSFLLVAIACYFYATSSELRNHFIDLVNL